MAVDVGQAAPDFSLYDTERAKRSLSEFKGKNVVLAFAPGAFTGTCTTEMCNLRDQIGEFNSLDAEILGITVDPPFSQKAWADANNLNFTILSDFGREATTAYDIALNNMAGMEGYVAANRAVFVVDKGGVVQYKWLAPTPGDLPDYDEIRQAIGKLG